MLTAFGNDLAYTYERMSIGKLKTLATTELDRIWRDDNNALVAASGIITAAGPIPFWLRLFDGFAMSLGWYVTATLFTITSISLLYFPTSHFMNWYNYRRLVHGDYRDRNFMITIKKSGRGYTSNSYAASVILNSKIGYRFGELLCSHTAKSSRRSVKAYQRIMAINPDDEAFPKLKNEWDMYLKTTRDHDKALMEFATSASRRDLVDLRQKEIEVEGTKLIDKIERILEEHHAKRSGIKATLASQSGVRADAELQALPPLSVL